jgi:competence ComEA-like helix-hairpin-helix protein
MTLTGIGEVKALAIIEYRDTHGSFGSKEEIQEVSGIGPATYDGIKDHIVVSGGTSNSSETPAPAPSPSVSSKASSPSPSPSSPSVSGELSVEGGSDRVVVVDAEVTFTARAYMNKKELQKGTNISWNFGDGSAGRGALISHQFEHPGRYAVIVTAVSDGQSASDRIIITAEDAQLSLYVLEDGAVEIINNATRDIELSEWQIHSGGSRFFFPRNTFVLGEQSLRISPATLGFAALTIAELLYPSGDLAFTGGIASTNTMSTEEQQAVETSTSPIDDSDDEYLEMPEADLLESRDVASGTSSQVAAAASTSSSFTWWAAAGAIALGAGLAAYLAKRASKREWNIVEDTEG